MIAWANAIRPPIASPWRTRAPIRNGTLCAMPGERRADHEQDDRELDQQLLADQVGQLAPDRGRHGHREQAGGDHPGVLRLAAFEVRDDRRQRVADDRRAEDRGEQRRQQADQDLEDLLVRQLGISGPYGGRPGPAEGAVLLRWQTSGVRSPARIVRPAQLIELPRGGGRRPALRHRTDGASPGPHLVAVANDRAAQRHPLPGRHVLSRC